MTETKTRDGQEIMQAGDVFLSDLDELFLAFTTGVVKNILSDFNATAAGAVPRS